MNNALDSKSLQEVWTWKEKLASILEQAENKEQVYKSLSENPIRRLGLKVVHKPSLLNLELG